jgi:hypothetical protein
MSSTTTIVTQSYLTIRATDKEVGVFYGDTNPQEAPAGFGKTLVEALRDFADELVKYNCDASGEELLDPAKTLMKCQREQDRIIAENKHKYPAGLPVVISEYKKAG